MDYRRENPPKEVGDNQLVVDKTKQSKTKAGLRRNRRKMTNQKK